MKGCNYMFKIMICLTACLGSSLSFADNGPLRFIDGKCIGQNGVVVLGRKLREVTKETLLADSDLGTCLNLARLDLSGLDLSDRDFSGSFFRNTNLSSSNLSHGVFFRTTFWTTNIEDADFSNSTLTETYLTYQDFENVNFHNAKLIDVNDFYVIFSRCNFTGAQISNFGYYALWNENDFSNADLTDMTSTENTIFRGSKFDRFTLLPLVFGRSVEEQRHHAVTTKEMIYVE